MIYDKELGDYVVRGGPTPWLVEDARFREDHTIELAFSDGKRVVFNMGPRLGRPCYRPLRSLPLFMSGRVENGTIAWDANIDVAPEVLYEQCEPA